MKPQRQNWNGCKISGYAAVSRIKPCRFSSAPEKTAGHSGGMGRHHLDHDGGEGDCPSGREHYFCVLQWKGNYSRGVMAPAFFGPPRACYRSMVFTKPAKKDFVQKIAHPSDTLWYQNGCAALEIVAYFDEKRTYLRFFVKTFAHR